MNNLVHIIEKLNSLPELKGINRASLAMHKARSAYADSPSKNKEEVARHLTEVLKEVRKMRGLT